jgi:hypothetical protein
MSKNKFMYICGEPAYQKLWNDTFNCLVTMRYLKKLYQNLEIIVCDNQVMAYRYFRPDCLDISDPDSEIWHIYDEESFSLDIFLNNILLIYRDI